MVGERITAIPRNVKQAVSDMRYSGPIKGTKNVARRFMDENKAAYYRTKGAATRTYHKAKSKVKSVVHR
jgi:hypothetical protein